MPAILRLPLRSSHLVEREHRVIAGMIGIVAGWPVDDLSTFSQREIVRNRDRLVMGDHPAVLGLRRRRPRPHARPGAGPHEVNRSVTAEVVMMSARRETLFMRTPTQLGGLQAFGDKALDRPGIHELAAWLGKASALGIALRDVDALDAHALPQLPPCFARARLGVRAVEIARRGE